MTFIDMQNDLIAELEEVLKDVRTKAPGGEETEGVRGYADSLPVSMEHEDDPSRFFPYFIVHFDTASTASDDDCWHIRTSVVVGAHDEAPERGHENVLVMVQRIVDRFARDPRFAKRYRVDQEMEWALQDGDTYPFYFGAVGLTISAPKIGRRGDY